MSVVDKTLALLRQNPALFETPCYVYDTSRIVQNYEELQAALGTPLVVSMKANSSVEIHSRCQRAFTGGTEIASIKELTKIAGGGGGPRFVNTPAMDTALIKAALAAKATLIVDHPEVLRRIASLMTDKNRRPVMLRLNSRTLREVYPEHPEVRVDHFGMDLEAALATLREARSLNVPVAGVHVFKGSHTFAKTATATLEAARRLIPMLAEALGTPISIFNLGGGLDESWRTSDFDFAAYRAALAAMPAGVQYLHEGGRAIFGDAGAFITRVLSDKRVADAAYVVCDGGMAQSFLLAGTENRFKRRAEPVVASEGRVVTDRDVLLVGSSCSKDDVIGQLSRGAAMPRPGDALVFAGCGAYHMSYTVSGFLSLPTAKEYVID